MSVTQLDLSSEDFINFSIQNPLLEFNDVMNEVLWEYRQGGAKEKTEAVVLIPGIYETTNSMFLIGSKLISLGYRVLIVSIPAYEKIDKFVVGLDQLTASLHIMSVHLVGVGFGGFLSLFVCSAKILSAEVKSISLIASFMESNMFKASGGFFSSFFGKGDLTAELSPNHAPSHLMPGIAFVTKEMESMPGSLLSSRIKCRSSKSKAPAPALDASRALIIQPLDWAYKMENAAKPHKVITGAHYATINNGGLLPHLSNPQEVLTHLEQHLEKWTQKSE